MVFLNSLNGVAFLMQTIETECKKEKVDWILLSRIFSIFYAMRASKNKNLVVTNYFIEMLMDAIKKGIKQQNHFEMVDFFKFMTFYSDQDSYWPPLVHRFVIQAALESIKISS